LNLLATGKIRLDESPRLDAYQVLTHGMIDENSDLFWDLNNFEKTLGHAMLARILKTLRKSGQSKILLQG